MRDSGHLRDYGPDRNVGVFVGKWIAFGILVVVLVGIIGWGIRWASVPGQVASPENVRKQWAFAYDYDESLQSAARQVCAAEQALADTKDATERSQRRSQLMALEQNYSRIQAEYNAKLRNAFDAKLVAPSDVPAKAPDLATNKSRVCR